MRVKKDFNNVTRTFYESGRESQIVKIQAGQNTDFSDKPFQKDTKVEVRMIRVELPETTEILMTSLKDETQYPSSIFKQLYALRWGVETFYDELKNKLKIEYFSGYSKQTILQDFYATLFVSNIQSLIVGDLNDELAKKTGQKYKYKINNNISYGLLKNRIINLLFTETDTDIVMKELNSLFKKHLVPIRPNRTNPRHNKKYKRRVRPKVAKNQKDAI